MDRRPVEGERVLIAAPYGRDAENVRELLAAQGYDARICRDVGEIAAAVDDKVGAVLVTEESLPVDLGPLRDALEAQPPWSSLPFILLAAPQTGRTVGGLFMAQQRLIDISVNLVLLERPLGTVSLISAVASALRARRKQFEMRDRLKDLAQAAETLEEKVAERTRALEEEVKSRTRTEEALRQSQKMEAVGQLTGGIAHDFNNMLTGVIGSLDIMKRRLASGRTAGLEPFMEAASQSAQRAAALTQRLLAFSRRQSLDSRPLDVNALVVSLEDLLERTIPEQIALRIVLAEGLPAATADPNQLESAIVNLAINARDAMPNGGRLTVETAAAEIDEAYAAAKPGMIPGRYVVIAVSDDGVGMEPEVLEKVFEPFFTTKPLGQGTGLGLSMVYGFARQNGGQVRIHSRPGEGTSVKVYLPVAEAEPAAEAGASAARVPDGQGQWVLVVEDDASVRLLIREVLSELGYEAVEAPEALAAIPILASERPIDLLISDVGLPGMTGRELAEVARKHRPALPILFVTGYAENAAMRAEFLGANMAMVTKPFSVDALARKIGEMLAGG